MISIDTSAFMKYLLHEKGWQEVHHYLTTAVSPTSVDLLVIGSANVLWKSVRKGFIQKEQVTELCAIMDLRYTKGPLALEPATRYSPDALAIALSQEIPVYNALFIAQARARHVALVTSDRQQARCAQECAVQTILL